MWFRSDLRTHDNKALHRAGELVLAPSPSKSKGIVAVFLLTPDQWREHDTAAIKVDLILRTLARLSADLAELNISLLIENAPRFADAPAALLRIAKSHKCEALVFNREYEVNESRRDTQVTDAFERANLRVEAFHDQVLIAPGDIRTAEGKGGFYTVFTPFKRAYFRELEAGDLTDGIARVLPPPSQQAPTGIAPSTLPAALPGFTPHVPFARCTELWPSGESHALDRLKRFTSRSIADYHELRDHPAQSGTSTLSPYLSIGNLSPRQCLAAAINANKGLLEHSAKSQAGPTQWISELVWREFYRHIIVGFPRISMGRAFKPATEQLRWNNNRAHFEAWQAGKTGVPIVDAGMRQLLATGWMHNRVRMITAMYLTKDLFIDWRWGEQHFIQHLIDGDLAQNNGGWQWSASTGTDSAPYFRIFNPITQSRKFDSQGDYIARYVPELASLSRGEKGDIHDPSDLPPLLRTQIDYPEPIVDRAKVRDRVITAFQNL